MTLRILFFSFLFISNIINPHVSIGQNCNLSAFAISNSNGTCGNCDKSQYVLVFGGTPPYTYVWSTGVTNITNNSTDTLSNLCAGFYTVEVTDGDGCQRIASMNVIDQIPGQNVLSALNVSCNGAQDGNATAWFSPSQAPYDYVWSTGDSILVSNTTTQGISNLGPGFVWIKRIDANNCTSVLNALITEPDRITSNPVVYDDSCGLCIGRIKVNPLGGWYDNYTIDWINLGINDTDSVFDLCGGDYIIKVTDSLGCLVVDTVHLEPNNELSIGFSTTHVDGNQMGSIVIDTLIGNPPFGLFWNTGETTSSIFNLVAGTYEVIVTDSLSCTFTLTMEVLNVTGELEPLESGLKITPFASGYVNFNGIQEGLQVSLYSLDGKLMFEKVLTSPEETVDFSKFLSGFYLLRVHDNSNFSHGQIIKF